MVVCFWKLLAKMLRVEALRSPASPSTDRTVTRERNGAVSTLVLGFQSTILSVWPLTSTSQDPLGAVGKEAGVVELKLDRIGY